MLPPAPHRRRRRFTGAGISICLLAALLSALLPALARAVDFPIKARQAILIDADSGAVLLQHNADQLMFPASMSKIIALLLIFKALKNGQVKADDMVMMSQNAWRKGGAVSNTSAMMVPVNTRERLDQMILGIIVQSGNDASIAVAEHIAGSEEAFARQMEEEAKRIGLKKSTFRNATGLHHPEHQTTARDLAIAARYLLREYPEYYAQFSQREFNYRRHRFFNRNPLLSLPLGVDGIKTGHTSLAGYGIVASAKQDNRRIILVVNGYEREPDRKAEAAKLIEWGFRAFGEFRLFDEGASVGEARVFGGERMYVPLTGNGPVSVVLPKLPANQKLKAEIIYRGPLMPPITKGDPVARLRVTSSSGATSEVQLFAGADVAKGPMWRRGLDSLLHLSMKWMR